jgi:hypothetical protein
MTIRYSAKPRKASGKTVNRIAPSTEPTIEPKPPRMIMIRISNDLINSNDLGFR